MACGVCIPFSNPFFPTTLKEVIPAEASSVGRFPLKATSRIVMIFSNAMSWHGLKIDLVSGRGANLPIATRYVGAPGTTWFTLISSAHEVVICGYWMGPDIEDGWGYVEAAVSKVFDC